MREPRIVCRDVMKEANTIITRHIYCSACDLSSSSVRNTNDALNARLNE